MARHADAHEPLDVPVCFGDPEVATMVGAVLETAQYCMVIFADGFIATAVVLVAAHVMPDVLRFYVFGYVSGERGHRALLELLDARSLLSLSLRLGEGSGAVLAYPMVVPAMASLCEMATFASAGVSERTSP